MFETYTQTVKLDRAANSLRSDLYVKPIQAAGFVG